MTPSEQCKAAGLDSLAELVRISGQHKKTLIRWQKSHKESDNFKFEGCLMLAAHKKKERLI